MKINSRDLLVSILVLLSVCLHAFAQNPPRQIKKQFMPADRRASRTVTELPRFFEENKGQADAGVKFLSRGKYFNLLLTNNQAVYQLPDADCQKAAREKSKLNKLTVSTKRKPCRAVSLQMTLDGARRDAAIAGAGEISARTDYYAGSDESRWQRGIANFESVRYRGIYDGIDAIFRGAGQDLEYDFVVAPGADPDAIRLQFDGAKKMSITAGGELVFKFGGVEIRHRRPVAYQVANGERREVAVKFVRREKNRIGFETGAFDASLELIIDPIVYASYLGGTAGGDGVNDIAVDREGNIYTATDARVSRLEPDGFLYTYSDVLISKFTPDGRTAVYFKYIGGSFDDVPYALDVEADGAAVVTGQTYSPDFPLRFAAQSTHPISRLNYDYTGFFIRLYADGDIRHSTYLGGSCPDEHGYSVAADTAGNAYVTGYTCSADFAAGNGFQTSRQGSSNAFLTKFDALGHIAYSTFFGTAGSQGFDVFAGEAGKVWVTGFAGSGVPTTAGAYSATETGFLAKFDTNASGAPSLVYSTRIPRLGTAVAADRSGNTWIAISPFPFRSFDTAKVIKLNNTGSQLLFESQNFGQQIRDLAVDGNGSAYFAANIWADNFSGGIRSKIYALRPNGDEIDTAVIEATRDDRVLGIALGPEPDIVYVGGKTNSLDFPTTPGAYQPTPNSPTIFGQGFFAKVQLNIPIEKEPLIFIPGVGGSTLHEVDTMGNVIDNLWMDGITQLFPPTKLNKLSLNPADAPFTNVIAVDAVRDLRIAGYNVFEVYGEFLENLQTQGNYKPGIGCSDQQTEEKPNLFIFPYDWRLSNANSAAKLKELVDCIDSLYPTKKVNILTHSMGGLVARRYIIDNPNNHNVNKWISMVAPWLGAAKALDSIHTGRFLGKFEIGGGIYLHKNAVKNIVEFGAGPHELLPSAWYFINGGKPFAYQSFFSSKPTEYSFAETYEFVNSVFSNQPYVNTIEFHNNPGQDNWNTDTSGIDYYHFYGKQKCDNTIGQFIIRPRASVPLSIRKLRFASAVDYTDGDGTVPTISANRPLNMLAPSTVVRPYNSPNCDDDSKFDHNGILGNEQFREEIVGILNENSAKQFLTTDSSIKPMNSSSENFNPEDLMNYLSISGVDRLDIFDHQGNTNVALGVADIGIQGISYEHGSSAEEFLEVPHEVVFAAGKVVNIKFRGSNEKIAIENMKGFGRQNATETIKYLDLQLPLGVTALLKFTEAGIENLRYDADSDGIFETEVQPTFYLTGAAANDRTPPNIDISFTVNNNAASVTVNAFDDETGINQIRYIVNGETTDHIYSEPFSVDLTQSKLLYVSAEDNAGNRNLLAKWLDVVPPNTIAAQMPASNQNGWSKENVDVRIKSLDDVGGSGVKVLTINGSGAQSIPEETFYVKEHPFTFPAPSTESNFLAKSLTLNTEGVTTLNFFAKDKSGNVETAKTIAIKIDKTAPLSVGNYSQNGNQMTVTLNSNDTLSGVDRITYSVDGGTLQNYNSQFSVSGNGNHDVTFFATDKAGNVEQTKSLSFTIVVVNPVVNIIAPSSGAVYPAGTTVNFAGSFTGDNCNSHTALWTFDNITQTGVVNESIRTVYANYTFTSAGVYLVSLTVNNNCGGTGSANTVDGLTAMIVVYDSTGGFVTGGGWIDSPQGAYIPNPSLIGRASFGFNSKYKHGATVPTGNTEFQFRVANFNFKSTSYDWLVVGGPRAQFKGSGTINGDGDFAFMLTAIDGQINGGGGQDKFRIKVWDKTTNNVIYDNQIGGSDNENPTTTIRGGSIIIHRQ